MTPLNELTWPLAVVPSYIGLFERLLKLFRQLGAFARYQTATEHHPKRSVKAGNPGLFLSSAPPVRSTVPLTEQPLFERYARARHTVLITGEPGTGKSWLAKRLHATSRRAGPFVMIDGSRLNSATALSELFGHERGAFTGASAQKKGCWELACGGTLFIDEIGNLLLEAQAQLLVAIEERVIRRVGGDRDIPVDVRLIVATNLDLEAEVAAGRFRRDLLDRLTVIRQVLLPLRERRGEIPDLLRQALADEGAPDTSPGTAFDPNALEFLLDTYDWPGNVRELMHAVARGLIHSEGRPMTLDDLQIVRGPAGSKEPCTPFAEPGKRRPGRPRRPTDDEMIRIEHEAGRSIGDIAARRNVSPSTISRRVRAFKKMFGR